MGIITASGTKIYIGAAVTEAEADSLPEFQAMTGWAEIGLVESIGDFGDTSSAVNFAAIGDGRVRKAKGARDAGTLPVTVAHDPLDAGQAAVEAAEATNDDFAFKVVLPDSPTPSYSDTVYYFRGLVMSKAASIGTNDKVVTKTYNIGVDSEIFTDPATL